MYESFDLGLGRQTWGLVELFCNMDIARLSDLNVDEALKAFTTMPWGSPADRPVDVSTSEHLFPLSLGVALFIICALGFYEKIAYAVENVLRYNNAYNPERLPRRQVLLFVILLLLYLTDHNAGSCPYNMGTTTLHPTTPTSTASAASK